jgi:hypothetical protein
MWLALLLVLLMPALAFAQSGPGLWQVAPGTQLSVCTNIGSPVTNRTWCADGNAPYNWRVWNGTMYVPISGGGGGTITGTGVFPFLARWSGVTGTVLEQSTVVDTGVEFGVTERLGVYNNPLRFYDATGTNFAALQGQAIMSTSYTCRMPGDSGTSGQVLSTDGGGAGCNLSWVNSVTAFGGGGIPPRIAIFQTPNSITNYAGTTCALDQAMQGLDVNGTAICVGNQAGLSGTTQFCNTTTTAAVVFSPATSTANYSVTLGTSPASGTPPHILADYNTRTTTGFNLTITDQPGTGNCVNVSWTVNGTAAGSSGTPGGSPTQVQYNAGGVFGGIANTSSDATSLIFANAGSKWAGSTSGNTTVNASAVASGTLTLPAATDTLVGKATTDIFTNKTYDTAGTGNVFKINGTQITLISGNTNKLASASGTYTLNDCAKFDASGNIVDAGGPCVASNVAWKTCTFYVGADNASAVLVDGDIAPQGRVCFVPKGATVVEVTVAADAGTPNVVVSKNVTGGAVTNLLSAALATASAGGVACSNTGGTTGLDGVTTCSATLINTAIAGGTWLQTQSATAGGAAKRMSIAVTWTVP